LLLLLTPMNMPLLLLLLTWLDTQSPYCLW
jgi:hypothetical protein